MWQEIFQFSGPPLLVSNLTNIWEYNAGSLTSDQEIMDMTVEMLSFESKDSLDLIPNYDLGDIACCFFPYVELHC